jgi:hypothetical protein
MPHTTREVSPGPRAGIVRTQAGELLPVPAGWVHLAPGDAALTRRVKAEGPVWTMSEKKGRKVFSLGLYAPEERIARHRDALVAERDDPKYARKLAQGRQRRQAEQVQYEEDFRGAVLAFLRFAEVHAGLADALAQAIADHATPVGSGTVARTKRIPIERRAEAATIAWLRHATTAYDDMQIPREKGARREVRRMLAEHSRALLGRYRRGEAVAESRCLLRQGLAKRA